jgi:hypothetical protein
MLRPRHYIAYVSWDVTGALDAKRAGLLFFCSFSGPKSHEAGKAKDRSGAFHRVLHDTNADRYHQWIGLRLPLEVDESVDCHLGVKQPPYLLQTMRLHAAAGNKKIPGVLSPGAVVPDNCAACHIDPHQAVPAIKPRAKADG